jgi:ATP:ADP antiporter, AAA family
MKAISDVFQYFLRSAFDIREGELRRAGLMQAYIFLIISTLLIVKPTVNGLFLTKFSVESLPNAFILVAITAAVVSTVYSRLLTRIPLQKIMAGTLIYSVVSLVLFGIFLLLKLAEGAMLYLLYIWVAIFALLATSQFWVLANLVFNAREAKRLFGFIGAGAIGGGIFGGYLTSALAQVMRVEFLLFACALLLFICIPIVRTVWKDYVVQTQTTFQQKKQLSGYAEHPFFLIRQSRHLTYLAGIVGVSVMVAKLVDYQFSGLAAAAIDNPDELTAFFGFWFSTFNLLSLLLQLFLTRRVVGTFGVGRSLFFLPSLIMVAALLLLFFPAWLPAAVFLKMSDGSLKQSINKAAMELIILPVPVEIKNQTKTFIDVFVDSAATGISGLILIFLIKGLSLPTIAISLMIVALISGWIYLAYLVRGEYLKSFKLKIDKARGEGVSPKKQIDLSSESAIGGLNKVLENGTEKQLLFVLSKVRELHNERFFEPVRKLLHNPSPDVQAEAVATLYFYKKHPLVEEVKPLIASPSQKVKIQAFEYLFEHAPDQRLKLMNEYLRDEDYRVRAAALVTLARDTRDNPRMKAAFGLGERILDLMQELPFIKNPEQLRFEKITLLKAIGHANIPELYEYVFPFFSDGNPEVVRHAILAAGKTLSPVFIDRLVRFLTDEQHRDAAMEALANYDKAIIPELRRLMHTPGISQETVRAFPSVVKKIGSQQSVNFLFELFDVEDTMLQQAALRGLNHLRNQFPFLHFDKKGIVRRILHEAKLYQNTLSALYAQMYIQLTRKSDPVTDLEKEQLEARMGLIRLMDQRLDRNLERIFRLLGLDYPAGDILAIYESLRSEKDDLRVNALEFLDNLLEPSIKRVIIPIIETSMLETITEEAVKNLNLKIPTEYDCFKMLLRGKDVRIKLAVLYLVGQLGDKKFLPLVEESLESGQEKVRDFAEGVMQELRD